MLSLENYNMTPHLNEIMRELQMAIFDTYSKRRKREMGEVVDVYSYNVIPLKLKNQIILILEELFERNILVKYPETVIDIIQKIKKEHGVLKIDNFLHDYRNKNFGALITHFSYLVDNNEVLDIIEFTFEIAYIIIKNGNTELTAICKNAIEELNERFKEHNLGYEFRDGKLHRIDSEFIHKEAVIPALTVLRQKGFENAQSEFLAAHDAYKDGKYSSALVECGKAFESTMKIILTRHKIAHDPKDNAGKLVDACFKGKLLPSYYEEHFAGLKSILKTAIPSPRNQQGGHGAGVKENPAPTPQLTSYVLHITASTILFLSEISKTYS